MLVGPLIHKSVGLSVRINFFFFKFTLILLFWGLQRLTTAPALLHATDIAVHLASWWIQSGEIKKIFVL